MNVFKPTYTLPLADYPYIIVRLWCWECPRRGNYRLARLAATYGAEITIYDLLKRLVGDCNRWTAAGCFSTEFCGASFPDLLHDDPPGVPQRQLLLRVVK